MSSNRFGKHFSITTWGESHGKAIGVVIDGCPSGIEIDEEMINLELKKRRPGYSLYTSPRKEEDLAEIYSGVFEGKTTGAPISIIIPNTTADSAPYEKIKDIYRPGHGNFTYLAKYGIFDYRGGGRSSARETACRVAAGAIAKAILKKLNIQVQSYLYSIGDIQIQHKDQNPSSSELFCPDSSQEKVMKLLIEDLKKAGDSIGGEIETIIHPIPIGLGDPVYEKIEAVLSSAILSIPAIKGIFFGLSDANMHKGSEYNDPFAVANDAIYTTTNNSGGMLGGISTGMPLYFKAICKPASSIRLPVESVTIEKEKAMFSIPVDGKHDPCIAIRAVPVVEAMTAISIVDLYLSNKLVKLY